MGMRPVGARATASVVLVAAFVIAGCSSSSPGEPASSATNEGQPSAAASEAAESQAAEATPGTTLTACELVAPADIEATLGLDPGTVGEGTLKEAATVLEPNGNDCRYEDQPWGGLVVSLSPTAGDKVYSSVNKVYGDSAEALEVGDGGLWFEDNDRGYFLKGNVMVILQFVFIADGTKFREPTIALGQAFVDKI